MWTVTETHPGGTVQGAELVLAALAAGGTAGATAAASTAVTDAYQGLKTALGRVFSRARTEPAVLDADEVTPDAWEARLGAALRASGAGDDPEVLAAARALLDLTGGKYRLDLRDAKGVQVGDGNTQHNTFN